MLLMMEFILPGRNHPRCRQASTWPQQSVSAVPDPIIPNVMPTYAAKLEAVFAPAIFC